VLSPAVARTDDTALLERFRPVYIHDAQERDPVAGVADSPPASYGGAVAAPAGGRWLQYLANGSHAAGGALAVGLLAGVVVWRRRRLVGAAAMRPRPSWPAGRTPPCATPGQAGADRGAKCLQHRAPHLS